MQLANFQRSTPFRLAVTFACLFIIAFLAAGAVAYQLLKRELLDNLDRSTSEIHAVIGATYGTNDMEDLLASVDSYARLTRPRERVFALVDPAGKLLAGDLLPSAIADGMSTVTASRLGLAFEGNYRVMAGPVGSNRLIIGQSFAETDHLEDIALRSFVWATACVIVLAFASGSVVAVRAQRRLDGIASAMTAVSHGQLETRVPLSGSGDDIDVVSRQINEALDRLSTLVETMRQVSSDIAHELKTPLNRLKVHIEDAVADHEAGRDARDSLQSARDEADQVNATFEALLRISQIEAGARKTRFGPVDVTQVLETVSEIYADVIEDAGMTLVDRVAGCPAFTVQGDRELLIQMVVNLVENAIRHCPPETQIVLSVAKDHDGAIRVSVADNGPGIPETEREKVFRRLYRLDKSHTTEGSGLGLSLVRAIADLHGGKVALRDNAPGLLSEVTLPSA